MKTKLTKIIVLTVASFSCASCGTMFGLGQDFQNLGKGLQKVAKPGSWRASSPAAKTLEQAAPDYVAPEYAAPSAYAAPDPAPPR